MSNGQATSIIRHFRSILSNTTMSGLLCQKHICFWLCSILLSVCILKSHSSLFSTGFIHWSWLVVVIFFIPVITQLFTWVPVNRLRHFVVPPTSILLLSKFLAFRYKMTNCLITFSAHSTLCRHVLLVNYPLYTISS